MVSAIRKEISFNLSCYQMARNNLSHAAASIKNTATSIIPCSINDSTCISLKDRCTNLAKAFGLLARIPLLYMPFINRVTQLALRLLSPKSLLSDLDSYPINEIKIRYSKKTLSRLVKEALLNKNNAEQQKVNKSDIDSLKKYDLTNQGILEILDLSREIQCSTSLKKEVHQILKK